MLLVGSIQFLYEEFFTLKKVKYINEEIINKVVVFFDTPNDRLDADFHGYD